MHEEHMTRYRLDKERQDNLNNPAYHLSKIAGRVAMRGRWIDPHPLYKDNATAATVTTELVATYNVKKRLTSKTGHWVTTTTERINNISNSNLSKWSIKE